MRRLFLILMIALLPLRGWVGEAMAAEMWAHQTSAIKQIAAHADTVSASGLFDAEMQMAQEHCAEHGDSESPDTAHCGTCPLCAVCHSVAAPTPWASTPMAWQTHAQPSSGLAYCASAPLACTLKPPIS